MPCRPIHSGVHAWESWTGETSWDIAAQALKTTRKKKINDTLARRRANKLSQRRKDWHAEEERRLAEGKAARSEPKWGKPQLTAEEKSAIAASVRPVTIMDYLYRLRIKGNYERADDFWEGPLTDEQARDFARNLVDLSSATLLVHELRIAQNIGIDRFLSEMDAWLRSNRHTASQVAADLRRQLHSTCANSG